MISSLHEFVSYPGEFRRDSGMAPICRKLANFNALSRQIVGNFCDCQDEIARRVIFIEVNEIFQQGEGLMF